MLLKRAENKLLYFLGSSKENQDPSESQIIDGIAKKRRLSVIAQHRRLGETFCIDNHHKVCCALIKGHTKANKFCWLGQCLSDLQPCWPLHILLW